MKEASPWKSLQGQPAGPFKSTGKPTPRNSVFCLPIPIVILLLLLFCDQCSFGFAPEAPPATRRDTQQQQKRNTAETVKPRGVTFVAGEDFDQQLQNVVDPQRGQQRARFLSSSPEDLLVYASSYQNEAYLPCKIANLDEEQTVSVCLTFGSRVEFSWCVCVCVLKWPASRQN